VVLVGLLRGERRVTPRAGTFCSSHVPSDRSEGVFRRVFRRASTAPNRSFLPGEMHPVGVMCPLTSPGDRGGRNNMRSGETRRWTLWLTCDDCGDIELSATSAVLR